MASRDVNGANFERWRVGAGEVLTIADGFVMVCGGVLRVDGLVRCFGVLRGV